MRRAWTPYRSRLRDNAARINWIRAAKISGAVLFVALLAVLIWFLFRGFDPQEILTRYGSPATMALLLLGIFLFKALVVVGIESTFIYIAAGMFFPVGDALLLVAAGLLLESLVTYGIGYAIGRRRMQSLLRHLKGRRPVIDRLLNRVEHSDPMVVLLMRLLPGFHNGVTSLVLGATRTNLLVFWPVSLIGMLPKAYASTLMGTAIYDPLSPMFLIPVATYLILIGGAVLLQRHLPDRLRPAREPEPPPSI